MKQKIKRLWQMLREPEKLLKYLSWLMDKTKPVLPSLGLMLLLDGVAVSIGFVSSFVSKQVVDTATVGQDFLTAFLIMIGISLFSLLLSSVVSIFSTQFNEKFAFSIRMRVFDHTLRANWLGLSKYHSGDLLTRLTSDVGTIASGIASAIPSLLMIGFRLAVAFIILYGYSPLLAISALVLGPAGLFMSLLTGEKLKQLSAEAKSNEAAYRSFLQENMANITVVKTFCQEEASNERLATLRLQSLKTILKRSKMSVMMNGIIRLLFNLGYFIAFGYCIFGLASGALTYGTMTLFLTLFSQIQQPIMSLSHLLPQLIGVLASVGRVLEIEEIPPEERAGRQDLPKAVGLRFSGVDFAYQDHPILRQVSFEARPGQMIGVMGESGAGKTTLIRLALVLTAPSSGQVEFLCDGRAEAASADVRRFIAYVPQGNSLLSGTIAENLRYGKPDATEDEMWEALSHAAADFVRKLPMGLDTPLGEKAVGISEGQAQRIAIARALLKQAPVLVLDEATSALDAGAEEKILSYLTAPDRTYAPLCLIITHRPQMVPYFDGLVKIEGTKAAFTLKNQ